MPAPVSIRDVHPENALVKCVAAAQPRNVFLPALSRRVQFSNTEVNSVT